MSARYTKDHEWARLEGDLVVCGISAYAAEQLGDVVYVELPEIGRRVKAHEEMAVVESAKTASDVYAPLAGEIVEVNAKIAESPEAVNEGPEAGGWFVKIRPDNASELETLMTAADYAAHLQTL